MKKVLHKLSHFILTVLIILLVLAVAVIVTLYVSVHTRLAGMAVEQTLTTVLAEQIGARVTVEENAEVSWNNQLVLNKLTIYDQQGEKMIYARRAMVAFEIWPLLHHHLVLNTCQLIDFDINTYRASADSATNYQFLVDALTKKKNPEKQPFIQELDLNFIVLRQGTLSYDVKDKPRMADSPIDPNHIKIEKLSANVHVHDKELLIKKFHCFEHNYAYRADRIKMGLNIGEILKAPAGEHKMLIYVKKLDVSGDKLALRADINGDSDTIELSLYQLSLPYGHHLLPGISAAQVNASVILSQLTAPIDSIYVSAHIHKLELNTQQYGELHISGNAEGTSHEASMQGEIVSDYGKIAVNTDIIRTDNNAICMKGDCNTASFDLGLLLPRQALNKANAALHFFIDKKPSSPLQLSLNGTLKQLDWKGHRYHNIELDCEGQSHNLQGSIALNDSLGNVDAAFDIDLAPGTRHLLLDGQIEHLNPNALHLSDIAQFDSLTISSGIHADLSGAQLADLQATVHLSNVVLERGEEKAVIGDFDFKGTPNDGQLESGIANAKYSLKKDKGLYSIRGNIPVANELLALLQVPVKMSNDVKFEARVDTAFHLQHTNVNIPSIEIKKGNYVSAVLTANENAAGLVRPILNFTMSNDKHQLKGILRGLLYKHPQMLKLEPSIINYNDDEIEFDGAQFLRDENGNFIIDDFCIKGGQQKVAASGIFSKDGEKNFALSLSNFDLGQIFSNFERKYVHFGGRATGDILLSGNTDLLLSSDSLEIRNFSYIDTLLGNAKLNLAYNIPQKLIEASCELVAPTSHQTQIGCKVDMSGEYTELDLRVHPDHLPLGFINYWCGSVLQDFSGTVTGDVRLFGTTRTLQLEGNPVVDGHFTHDVVGAFFHLNDTVKLSHNMMRLDNAHIDDGHGHPMRLSASIPHDNLHNFGYNVDLVMPNAKQGFLVLNRPKAPGRMYWGQIYASGTAHLEGGHGKHRIDVDFSTTDKSWIFVSPRAQGVNPDQEAYSFLTFRDKAQLAAIEQQDEEGNSSTITFPVPDIPQVNHSDIEVKLVANATEQCEVTVQMDPSSEDLLSGRGIGTLNIIYDPQHDLKMMGEYHIKNGTYTMNFNPDVMSKRFQLQSTSMVSFTGVPSEANLKLDAVLSLPSVNLSDLGQQVTALKSLSRTTVPIDCKMNVSGQLSAPLIEFDLEVKNGNKEVDDLVHNAIGTPEMINQQVLYLLIFSKFYPPEDAQSNSQMRAGAEISSLASASISSQLNQLLNRLSDNFTLGTNFKSDRGDFTDMEMDLSLSTRLLNDRLLLYGNVGYRDPANRIGMVGNTSSFIGDFDIEYILNTARTMRVKVYSHYNERDYSINNALTTQGVGMIYSRDFDTFWQIWNLKNWHKKKAVSP